MGRDGFETEAAMFAFSSAMSFVLGAVLVERMMDGHPPVPVQRLALVKSALDHLPPRAHPRVLATAPKFGRWTFDGVFELGLQSLLDGLERSCARQVGRRQGRR